MFDELNQAIARYRQKWTTLIEGRHDRQFFNALRPTAVAWKTTDRAEYDKLFHQWHDACDYIFETWMNGRYVAKMHLKDGRLDWGIEIIKLMQRRPASTDPVGLDHVDFYTVNTVAVAAMQSKEADLKWTDEVNGICRWTSLWFEDTEAKLRNDTVMNVGVAELQELEKKLTTSH
ncbi:MAG TPA: hypothetical protein VGS08_02530 [Candidatus Saccharimonadales bacterium]|nr:hypothetical protein [Candidatus Saccharimonadales bacterium]